jgi:hypothetical protein
MPENANEYRTKARQLLGTITQIDGLELRLFSLKQKKQVKKEDFLNELFED